MGKMIPTTEPCRVCGAQAEQYNRAEGNELCEDCFVMAHMLVEPDWLGRFLHDWLHMELCVICKRWVWWGGFVGINQYGRRKAFYHTDCLEKAGFVVHLG